MLNAERINLMDICLNGKRLREILFYSFKEYFGILHQSKKKKKFIFSVHFSYVYIDRKW